jgi:RNase P subunit RPR2
MNWYCRIKTAAPYTENICPCCTQALLIDFYHERGPKYKDTPFVVGECPKCGAAMRIHSADGTEMMGFNQSNAQEMTHQQYMAARMKGIPSVLVAPNEDDNTAPGSTPAATRPKIPALAQTRWWK